MPTTIRGREPMKEEKDYLLSDEVYVNVQPNNAPRHNEAQNPGVRLRLISGVAGVNIPGFHYRQGWVTVCRERRSQAEWQGIEERYIQRV